MESRVFYSSSIKTFWDYNDYISNLWYDLWVMWHHICYKCMIFGFVKIRWYALFDFSFIDSLKKYIYTSNLRLVRTTFFGRKKPWWLSVLMTRGTKFMYCNVKKENIFNRRYIYILNVSPTMYYNYFST